MHTDTEMVPESKSQHVWRKIVWHTDPDKAPLGPYHSAEIYCCEEANAYSVWYVRKLSRGDPNGTASLENGDYLLAIFAKRRRDAAIEKAVLLANSGDTPEQTVVRLDELARQSQKA